VALAAKDLTTGTFQSARGEVLMGLRFTVLASGSAGNASLLEADGFGLLLDAGLGPRTLADRLGAVGASWQSVHGLLLTHTHCDHWNERTLAHLVRRRIPIYCHPDHHGQLEAYSLGFAGLRAAGLVHGYEANGELVLAAGLRCRPLPLRHDGGATFGFRFEGVPDLFGPSCALAYVADLGCWDGELLEALLDVDVLALEFNHDVEMEYASGRQPRLIARVLGDEGHLSNEQAAALLREVLRRSTPGRLQHLVQLHLSRECNRPELAASAAGAVLTNLGMCIEVHTARQSEPCRTLHLSGMGTRPVRPGSRKPARGANAGPPWLPGLESA
jgi:phosphoribosyl 1,2-cyclic phosphodiesterase